jgi:tetratricopeptide (TPR) repeat protein
MFRLDQHDSQVAKRKAWSCCAGVAALALFSLCAARSPVARADAHGVMYESLRQQGEALALRGRHAEAVRTFQRARRAAATPEEEARVWFRIAGEYSRMGALAPALDAYTRQQQLIPPDAVSLANAAELLMALGRLDEAVQMYREALALEEGARDRRGHLSGLALGYLGLGAALDRSDRPHAAQAAREAVGRGLALDPGLGVLRLVEQGSGDLSVIPPEDVSYYLALARLAQGRPSDAAAAFRAYIDRASKRAAHDPVTERYVVRARGHLTELAGAPAPAPRRSSSPSEGRGLRVLRTATVEAKGPIVAPLVDAAWRLEPHLLDACLADVPWSGLAGPPRERGAESARPEPARPEPDYRLRIEVVIDGGGRIQPSGTQVQAAVTLPEGIVPCIASALENRLRVPPPARKRPTRARIEVVLAPVEPSGV